MSGQVHLHVLEARNLWTVDPKTKERNPYVTVKIFEGKEMRKNKTKQFKGTTNPNPVFNEEFVFAVGNKATPIIVKVANEKIGNNEELGEASLDLTRVPDNVYTDMWLPVNGGKGNQPAIHVSLVFTPQPVALKFQKRVFVRILPFRFGLERSTYFAGETMKGVLFLNVGQPIDLHNVRIFFEGIQHVYWAEQHSAGRTTYTVIYSKTTQIFSAMTTLCGIEQIDPKKKIKDSVVLPSGHHVFPFQFTFPVNVPPSMQIDSSWTRYRVRAKLDKKGRKKWITAPVNLCIEYASLQETSDIAQKTKKYGKQPITVTAMCTKDILYLGEVGVFQITLDNQSDKKVNNVKVTLMKKYTLHATAKVRTWKVRHFQTVVKDPSIFPIHGGTKQTISVNFPIPDGLQPSMPPSISPIIHITYTIKIAADISGMFSGKVRAYIPMKIGWRIPDALKGIPIPLVPQGVPTQILLGKDARYNIEQPMILPMEQPAQERFESMQMPLSSYYQGAAFQPVAPSAGYQEGESEAQDAWSVWQENQRVQLPQGHQAEVPYIQAPVPSGAYYQPQQPSPPPHGQSSPYLGPPPSGHSSPQLQPQHQYAPPPGQPQPQYAPPPGQGQPQYAPPPGQGQPQYAPPPGQGQPQYSSPPPQYGQQPQYAHQGPQYAAPQGQAPPGSPVLDPYGAPPPRPASATPPPRPASSPAPPQ